MSKDEDDRKVIELWLKPPPLHLRKQLGESHIVPHRHCGEKLEDVDWGIYLKGLKESKL